MTLLDELKELQKLHEAGFLTDRELEQAKARVLRGETTAGEDTAEAHPAPPVTRQMEALRLQSELDRLDREWQVGREDHMLANKYGRPRVPGKTANLVGAWVIGAAGLAWIVGWTFQGLPQIGAYFGVPIILFGVGHCVYAFNKARDYEVGEARYQQRRADLEAKLRAINPRLTRTS